MTVYIDEAALIALTGALSSITEESALAAEEVWRELAHRGYAVVAVDDTRPKVASEIAEHLLEYRDSQRKIMNHDLDPAVVRRVCLKLETAAGIAAEAASGRKACAPQRADGWCPHHRQGTPPTA